MTESNHSEYAFLIPAIMYARMTQKQQDRQLIHAIYMGMTKEEIAKIWELSLPVIDNLLWRANAEALYLSINHKNAELTAYQRRAEVLRYKNMNYELLEDMTEETWDESRKSNNFNKSTTFYFQEGGGRGKIKVE